MRRLTIALLCGALIAGEGGAQVLPDPKLPIVNPIHRSPN